MSDTRRLDGSDVILSNISKSHFSQNVHKSTPVIADVSMKIEKGSTLAIIRPSGCGKNTLLNLIGALLSPDSGDIVIDGVSLSTIPENEIAEFRSQRLGFLFQEHNLLPQLDVLENILLPTLAARRHTAKQRDSEKIENSKELAVSLLSRVDLSHVLRAFPEELSGGEKQRVALVRALINRPSVLLADEPTGSLDALTAKKMSELIFEINREQGMTLVIATHSSVLAEMASARLLL